jgi:hypothetical protein
MTRRDLFGMMLGACAAGSVQAGEAGGIQGVFLAVGEMEKVPLGVTAENMIKLIKGGFVDGDLCAPNGVKINVISLQQHIERAASDPGFWTAERIERFYGRGAQ